VPEKILLLRKVRRPLISVIIPTLNEEKYIEKTLLSVRSQTFKKPYEVIVADSNSQDSTIEIAKTYADKIIITEKEGASVGRNLGARISEGKILLFLDADTILLPNVLEEIYKAMKKKSLVACNIPLFLDKPYLNLYYSFHIPIYKLLAEIKLNPIYAVVLGCRKKVFEKLGGFNEELKVAEDIEFGERLKKIGKVEYLTTTFAISSSRRFTRFKLPLVGMADTLFRWIGSYFYYNIGKRQFSYPPVR